MPATQKPFTVSRRGFRQAPPDIRAQAEAIIAGYAIPLAVPRVRAELRPASYTGPGSPGDLGAYTFCYYVGRDFHMRTLYRIEA